MILNIDPQVIMFYVTYSFYALASLGLIFFIINGILKENANYVFRGVINLIVGGIITIIFAVCWIIDGLSGLMGSYQSFPYILFLGISGLFTLIISLSYIITGKQRYQRLTFKKVQPSINRDINQYVYIIYKCDKQVILREVKEKIQGFVVYMDKRNMFKDEIIAKMNQQNEVTVSEDNIHQYGVCTVNGKKPDIYYCYLVDVESMSSKLQSLKVIDAYDIIALPLEELDKQIILRTLLRQDFKIYL